MLGYLTLEEAAEELGVDYKTVYRLVRQGELPAGKVGRIYRIRRDDLEGYFEQQKKLVVEQGERVRLMALEGICCGACGKGILSELSIGGKCSTCGREICQACWSIRKLRTCKEHLPEETRNLEESEPAPDLADDPTVVADVISELREGGRAVATPDDIGLAEETFIRVFAQRVENVETLPDAVSGVNIPLSRARVKHTVEDGQLPFNRTSRFVLKIGGWGKPKGCLTLSARFISRADRIRSRGYDADPMDEATLLAFLNSLAAECKGKECFVVVLIGSPTGWTAAARAIVAQRDHGKAFHDQRVAVALSDFHSAEVTIDETDKRLWPFWPILAPRRNEEKVQECVVGASGILETQSSVSLAEAVQHCGADDLWMRAAFDRMCCTGDFVMDELPEIGMVISRPST